MKNSGDLERISFVFTRRFHCFIDVLNPIYGPRQTVAFLPFEIAAKPLLCPDCPPRKSIGVAQPLSWAGQASRYIDTRER